MKITNVLTVSLPSSYEKVTKCPLEEPIVEKEIEAEGSIGGHPVTVE